MNLENLPKRQQFAQFTLILKNTTRFSYSSALCKRLGSRTKLKNTTNFSTDCVGHDGRLKRNYLWVRIVEDRSSLPMQGFPLTALKTRSQVAFWKLPGQIHPNMGDIRNCDQALWQVFLGKKRRRISSRGSVHS